MRNLEKQQHFSKNLSLFCYLRVYLRGCHAPVLSFLVHLTKFITDCNIDTFKYSKFFNNWGPKGFGRSGEKGFLFVFNCQGAGEHFFGS